MNPDLLVHEKSSKADWHMHSDKLGLINSKDSKSNGNERKQIISDYKPMKI